MRLNVKKAENFTHEGAKAKSINPEQELRRSVMSCFLWEGEFYEDGKSISDRIRSLAESVPPAVLAKVAIDARNNNLRHVPLLLVSILAKTGSGSRLVQDTIYDVIRRPDELGELLAIYWKDGKKPLSAQLKKGLARAFGKFDEYQLGKWNKDGSVKLRDVLFLSHAKGNDALYKKVADKTLDTPDTWEVALSSGADKKATFERLLKEEKLGYFALIRNLRNMQESGVDESLVRKAILDMKGADKILPFRYIAAAKAAPMYEPELDKAMLYSIDALPALKGQTVVLVDVSGSMDDKLSQKSDLRRIDAAAALASIINGSLRVFTFSQDLVEVPARKGMSGVDAIIRSQPHQGTYLGAALQKINQTVKADRIIVITDEQSHDSVPDSIYENAYMINVASYKNGVGYHKWTHIDGFSENIIRFIYETENNR